MDSKDVRILAKKVLMRKKFIKASDLKSDTWTATDAAAWKNFCYSIPGFAPYCGKIPNEITISAAHIKQMKSLISGEKKEAPVNVNVDYNATPASNTLPKEEAVEAPVVTAPAEEPVVTAPAAKEEPSKKGGKKGKK